MKGKREMKIDSKTSRRGAGGKWIETTEGKGSGD